MRSSRTRAFTFGYTGFAGIRRKRKGRISSSTGLTFFSTLSLALAIPAMTTVALIQLSSRPSLEDRKLAPPFLDWPTLRSLYPGNPESFPQREIQVAGYMLTFDEFPDQNGKVGRFLLSPDCGNWFHPAHLFEPSHVIVVLMKNHQRVRIAGRTLVVLEGKLSRQDTTTDTISAGFILLADQLSFAPRVF